MSGQYENFRITNRGSIHSLKRSKYKKSGPAQGRLRLAVESDEFINLGDIGGQGREPTDAGAKVIETQGVHEWTQKSAVGL